MNNQEINPTESCFIELNSIGYRLTWASETLFKHAQLLPDFVIKGNEPTYASIHKFMVRSMWEYMILNLYKLLEIHDSILGKILKKLDATELEKSLEECWKPIKELKKEIGNFRNILAHSKDQANNYYSYMDKDPNFYKTQTKVIIATKAAILYISEIFENLSDVNEIATISHQARVGSMKLWYPQNELPSVDKELKKILEKTKKSLNDNGFIFVGGLSYQ